MPRKCIACSAGLRAPLSAQREGCGASRVLPSGSGAVVQSALSVRAAGRGSRGSNVSTKKKKILMLALNKECVEAGEKT